MLEILSLILAVAGVLFIFVAALGLLRMPDLFLRMSTTTKAATLGVGLLLVAVAIYFNDLAVTVRVLGIIVFLLLTAPVAAHMIGRAAHRAGTPLWDETVMDELRSSTDQPQS